MLNHRLHAVLLGGFLVACGGSGGPGSSARHAAPSGGGQAGAGGEAGEAREDAGQAQTPEFAFSEASSARVTILDHGGEPRHSLSPLRVTDEAAQARAVVGSSWATVNGATSQTLQIRGKIGVVPGADGFSVSIATTEPEAHSLTLHTEMRSGGFRDGYQAKPPLDILSLAPARLCDPLPSEPVGPGAVWRVDSTLDEDGVKVHSEREYELIRFAPHTVQDTSVDLPIAELRFEWRYRASGEASVGAPNVEIRGRALVSPAWLYPVITIRHQVQDGEATLYSKLDLQHPTHGDVDSFMLALHPGLVDDE
ncbi:MAG: hypothetical protein KIT72_03290 [Polyangiaceae bacterium]|nr:hypothetical protein [Polyangiaceae bacterium]MCW5789425.1 hypothetical protein [Polyangiaceae bacterium]